MRFMSMRMASASLVHASSSLSATDHRHGGRGVRVDAEGLDADGTGRASTASDQLGPALLIRPDPVGLTAIRGQRNDHAGVDDHPATAVQPSRA